MKENSQINCVDRGRQGQHAGKEFVGGFGVLSMILGLLAGGYLEMSGLVGNSVLTVEDM